MRPSPRRPASRPRHAQAPPLSGRQARQPAHRPRRFGTLDERARRRTRKLGLLAIAAVELAALVALLVAPLFHVRHVDVTGNRRLTAAQVVAAAGLQHPGSVFQVDPPAVERRLASVSAQLPDRVTIRLDEWRPVAVYRTAGGAAWYLSDEGVTLGPAGADVSGLLAVDGPARPVPRPGRALLERALLTALVNIQRSLPGLIGQDVGSFSIDSCGNLTLNAVRGWRAQFGRMLTPEERATLKDKVAALKSLAASGQVDFDTVQYVNVMNPAAVAVPNRGRGTRPAPSPAAQPVSPCA